MQLTILGLGNLLLEDEGFGVRFIEEIGRRYIFPAGVKLVDGGTLGYGLLDTISSCDRLLVIDIIKSDDRPGSIYRFNRREMELRLPPPTSAHEVEFFDVLNKAELMEALPETVFLCIVPKRYGGELKIGLSAPLRAAFPAMEELLLKELAAWGVKPRARENQGLA